MRDPDGVRTTLKTWRTGASTAPPPAEYPWADEVRAVRAWANAIRREHGLRADTRTCSACGTGVSYPCPERQETDRVMIRAGIEDAPTRTS